MGSGRVGQESWQGYSIVQGQSSAWGTVGLGRKAGLGGRGQSRTDGVQYDRGAGKKGGIRAGQKCKRNIEIYSLNKGEN